MPASRSLHLALALGAALSLGVGEIEAAAPLPSASVSAPIPLARLPKPPPLALPPASPAAREALDAHLERLLGSDPGVRQDAIREILEVGRDRVPAIHERLSRIAESADKNAMKLLLGGARDEARDAARRTQAEEGNEAARPDTLEVVSAAARPTSESWRDLMSVVAMSRMLRQIGTVAASRELVGIFVRFGEMLRVDTARQLEGLGERSIAALIEAERHPAEKVSKWASLRLDALGKGAPAEAVQTGDPEVLADVLRAYGRARVLDAARLVVSFAGSDRVQIRDAARESVVLYGEVIAWQLRDAYENVVGRKPSREWSWDRTARELFTELDGLRLASVRAAFDRGLGAERRGDLDDAVIAFDEVLLSDPSFEEGHRMVGAYVAHAKDHLDDAPAQAVRNLRHAWRISTDPEQARQIESSILTLEAEASLRRGIADQTLLRRALDLDPKNTQARRLFDQVTGTGAEALGRRARWATAGVIGVLAAIAIAMVLRPGTRGGGPGAEASPPT